MRIYQTLSDVNHDTTTGLLTLSSEDADTVVMLRREGDYVVFSAAIGALEIALRFRYDDAAWTLTHLQANDSLSVTRQIGSGQAYLGVGQQTNGALVLRPVVVGDASGQVRMTVHLTPEAAQALIAWISV